MHLKATPSSVMSRARSFEPCGNLRWSSVQWRLMVVMGLERFSVAAMRASAAASGSTPMSSSKSGTGIFISEVELERDSVFFSAPEEPPPLLLLLLLLLFAAASAAAAAAFFCSSALTMAFAASVEMRSGESLCVTFWQSWFLSLTTPVMSLCQDSWHSLMMSSAYSADWTSSRKANLLKALPSGILYVRNQEKVAWMRPGRMR
mmetsp:Transcript_9033/g.23677  ORF Transcript_9033/g.23677 Transcript_9033/m.23677 type:complete len:204 (-) Transcript_9033:605-1216(-)